jgi:hypothetical protein
MRPAARIQRVKSYVVERLRSELKGKPLKELESYYESVYGKTN